MTQKARGTGAATSRVNGPPRSSAWRMPPVSEAECRQSAARPPAPSGASGGLRRPFQLTVPPVVSPQGDGRFAGPHGRSRSAAMGAASWPRRAGPSPACRRAADGAGCPPGGTSVEVEQRLIRLINRCRLSALPYPGTAVRRARRTRRSTVPVRPAAARRAPGLRRRCGKSERGDPPEQIRATRGRKLVGGNSSVNESPTAGNLQRWRDRDVRWAIDGRGGVVEKSPLVRADRGPRFCWPIGTAGPDAVDAEAPRRCGR